MAETKSTPKADDKKAEVKGPKNVPPVDCEVTMDFTWAGKQYQAGQTVTLGHRQAKRFAAQSIVELP